MMNILLLEPFFSGSHRSLAEGYQRNASHNVELLTLAVSEGLSTFDTTETIANKYIAGNLKPDVILATDTLDLNLFLKLTAKQTAGVPVALYFHESFIDGEQGEINYASASVADKVFFNSAYHLEFFLQSVSSITGSGSSEQIAGKSEVLPYGMDLSAMDALKPHKVEKPNRAVVLWNNTWNTNNKPEDFFSALTTIADRGVDFRTVILGEQSVEVPKYLTDFKARFSDRILQCGYVKDYKEYIYWLSMSDILPVTSLQDFFGASIIEAMYCDVVPLLPRRLAYPEHIPQQFYRTFFYDDYEHMVNRLHRLIMDVRVIRPQKLGHFINKYDWSKIAPMYDAAMASLK